MPISINGQELQRNHIYYKVDPRMIEVEPGFNIRQYFDEQKQAELVESIRANGVKVPLIAYKDGNRIVLTNGHRRLRAVQTLLNEGHDFKWISVEFEEAHCTAAERIITALATNEGERLTPLEEAEGFRRLSAVCKWSHQQIATRVGKSVSYVTQRLALLEASPALVDAITSGAVSPTAAVQIVRESRNGSTQADLLAKEPASKEEKALKSFTRSLDKIGLDEAILAFIAYSKKEELEYLIEPFTLALKAHERHTLPAAKKRIIGDEYDLTGVS